MSDRSRGKPRLVARESVGAKLSRVERCATHILREGMGRIGAEVERALASQSAVVALESTVIAHGLPRPVNLEVGHVLEGVVRAGGATPATIAVLGGEPVVGITSEEMGRIASASDVLKLSTRDLPVAVAERRDGATTVAATMWLAHRAGVAVFATGGIGGVHRGSIPDISADILELARTPMIVVCAGAKAILDLSATREALESSGVLVVGWATDELPAFYSRESGLAVDVRIDSATALAELWRAHRELGAPGAILVCVPPPIEHAIPADELQEVIASSIERAREAGIRGKEITPFLLRELASATDGRSLEVNVALLRTNAGVAAQIAKAIAR